MPYLCPGTHQKYNYYLGDSRLPLIRDKLKDYMRLINIKIPS